MTCSSALSFVAALLIRSSAEVCRASPNEVGRRHPCICVPSEPFGLGTFLLRQRWGLNGRLSLSMQFVFGQAWTDSLQTRSSRSLSSRDYSPGPESLVHAMHLSMHVATSGYVDFESSDACKRGILCHTTAFRCPLWLSRHRAVDEKGQSRSEKFLFRRPIRLIPVFSKLLDGELMRRIEDLCARWPARTWGFDRPTLVAGHRREYGRQV